MISMLKDGRAGLEAFAVQARAMGLVLSDDVINKAAQVDDHFDVMGSAAKAAGIRMAAEFEPAMRKVAELMTSSSFQEGTRVVAGHLKDLVEFLVRHGDKVVIVLGALGGMKLGASLGRVFGPAGAALGAFTGAAVGAAAANEVLEESFQNVDGTVTQLTVNAGKLGPALSGSMDQISKSEAELIEMEAKLVERAAERVARRRSPAAVRGRAGHGRHRRGARGGVVRAPRAGGRRSERIIVVSSAIVRQVLILGWGMRWNCWRNSSTGSRK
jgi:hypothetical protein